MFIGHPAARAHRNVPPCLFVGMLVLAILILVPLVGCGSASRAVRLDTGQNTPLVHTPRGGEEPVELRKSEFKETLAGLARDVRPASSPLQYARRLMFDSPWHEEVYLEWTGRRLVLDSEAAEALDVAPECHELTRAYGRWCERKGRPRDCLSLLKEGPVLSADGRYTLAMEFAMGTVWNESMEAFKGMADPEAVRATIVSAMAMYMMLWVLPEPVSKGLAATLTAGLIAYLGVDTVWNLIEGWRRLVIEVDRASSFAELRGAGERYGKVMGRNAARAFALLATAAIGNTAGLAVKGPGLPGYSQAAVLAERQGGFQLAALSEVRSVALSTGGAFTISLSPGAVAMVAKGNNGGNASDEPDSLEQYWRNRQAPRQVEPGRRIIVEEKPGTRGGEVYKRTSYYDKYGRLIGQTHETSHGRPGSHPNPHHHRFDPRTGQELINSDTDTVVFPGPYSL